MSALIWRSDASSAVVELTHRSGRGELVVTVACARSTEPDVTQPELPHPAGVHDQAGDRVGRRTERRHVHLLVVEPFDHRVHLGKCVPDVDLGGVRSQLHRRHDRGSIRRLHRACDGGDQRVPVRGQPRVVDLGVRLLAGVTPDLDPHRVALLDLAVNVGDRLRALFEHDVDQLRRIVRLHAVGAREPAEPTDGVERERVVPARLRRVQRHPLLRGNARGPRTAGRAPPCRSRSAPPHARPGRRRSRGTRRCGRSPARPPGPPSRAPSPRPRSRRTSRSLRGTGATTRPNESRASSVIDHSGYGGSGTSPCT